MFLSAPYALVAMIFLLGLSLVMSLLFAFRDTLREFHILFDRRLLRFALRFRLRTLLVLFTAIQVGIGATIWMCDRGEAPRDIVLYLALGACLICVIYYVLREPLRPAVRKRWQFLLKLPHTLPPLNVSRGDKPPIRRHLVILRARARKQPPRLT